ncbi:MULTISPECIES: DEAD/DEAH box helicase [unclassified Flavobacterium]|uniref:DEAD/DEAH box helicase n=1 Tax=unclassified Flavobacterium TaxID=196869 RepID=UPI001F131D21|nr:MULTISPECIES: DEAD/DEAH box helicase [unclassified Flavobacterium]UMY64368.1 Helicase associated domain protein [Flavobacterium sp. HJ-32-4]
MTEYKNILKELIKDKTTWRQLKPELSKYNVNSTETAEKDTRAGKIFEVFTKLYFLVSPTEKDNLKNVWLFEETPLEVRHKLNLGNQDYGVDLVLQDIEDQYFVVQCKYKNNESSRLNWSADKIANLFAFCPNANGYIVFSNAVDLDNVSKTRHENFTFYGVDSLNEIDKETFDSIYRLLTQNQLVERRLYDPLPHQEIAINECIQWFTDGEESRGQLILPCGAGKTYTALWIKEKLESKNTLVLVPSLALLRQIKNEWSKQRRNIYHYLCVCSETDIDRESSDTLVTYTYEIGTRVTTDSEHVKSFLFKPLEGKVIFSTYHSLQVIADAIKEIDFAFDFVFCDEAHKTAGVGNNKFSLIHDNNRIPSKYRLYATATPRIVKESLKKKFGEDLKYTYDMNDPNTFGYEFHRMNFKDAIEEEILVDYKIVAIGVNSDELKEYIEQRRFVDKNISIDELANNYALEYVMQKYNVNHGLTFHSRVKLAQEFANTHGKLFPNTKTFSVSGEQPTSYRNLILEEFKNSEKAIISNARCLTEGVDVPTIDLVYFCDPKNSKVDIVQAVGRALRKKEGKKLGLIVVPIYHSKKDEVENSISSGSFRNLLQVIRSLCDQDERLQDEINFLAFGKGERKSKKIDIISSSFIDEQEKIILDGFEEKLRNSLFDQIIEKSSNNWDLWFLKLKNYLESNNQEYPSKKDDKDLYNWIASQRNRKKNGTLKNEDLRKLNSINFVWSIVEWKWDRMFSQFQLYSVDNVFPPCRGIDDHELVEWYKYQSNCVRENKILSKEQKMRFLKIDRKFEGPSSRKKWFAPYNELVKFRIENQDSWPQYNRDNPKSLQSELNVFCQSIRKRFREGVLENYWFEKMLAIGFNFEGKTDHWTDYWKTVKELLESKKSVSIKEIGENAYSWVIRHKRKYDNGELNEYEFKKIEELNLDQFFETWEETFHKIREWVATNGKLPTRTTQKEYHSWLGSQRSRYKNERLSEEQIKALQSIEYDLDARGKEKEQARWIEMFEHVKLFKSENNSWPKFGVTGIEGKMYNWCQAQRQAQAGTHSGGKRKPLNQWQVDKLESIDFHWSLSDLNNLEWESKYIELERFLQNHHLSELMSTNKLWRWIYNQNNAYEKGGFDEVKHKRLLELGVDISQRISSNGRDGFGKWSWKIREVAKFIDENGHYPKAGTDKVQRNLYQSLARTKRAYLSNELSEKQLELLKQLKIDLD